MSVLNFNDTSDMRVLHISSDLAWKLFTIFKVLVNAFKFFFFYPWACRETRLNVQTTDLYNAKITFLHSFFWTICPIQLKLYKLVYFIWLSSWFNFWWNSSVRKLFMDILFRLMFKLHFEIKWNKCYQTSCFIWLDMRNMYLWYMKWMLLYSFFPWGPLVQKNTYQCDIMYLWNHMHSPYSIDTF